MIRRLTLACVGFALCAAGAAQLFAADPESAAALDATDYIRTLQNTDGGFPDFGSGSSASATLEAVFAFAATGVDARTVQNGGQGPDDYLASQAAAYSGSAGGAAKLVAGLAAMDIDPTSFGGVGVLAAMESNYVAATGKYGDDVFAQSLFMLAKAALDQPVPAAAADYLQSLQQADGGWEYCCGWGTDTNTTSLAVRALIAAGVPAGDPDIAEAITFLHGSQQADGGFPYAAPGSSDPNSTAYVIQAIVATGQSAEGGGTWDLGGGANPLAALAGFQNPATGALQYFGSDSPFATYQGVPALMLSAFPEQFDPDAGDPNGNGDGDACLDGEELGINHVFGGQRNPVHFYDFYDVDGTKSIGLSDTLLILQHFGHAANGDALDNLLDRYIPDMAQPWRTAEANNGIGLLDALVNLRSFGDSCAGLPN